MTSKIKGQVPNEPATWFTAANNNEPKNLPEQSTVISEHQLLTVCFGEVQTNLHG